MRSIDDFFERIKLSVLAFADYLAAKSLVRRYEKNKPPYNSLDYKNGLVTHEVVGAYDIIESFRS